MSSSCKRDKRALYEGPAAIDRELPRLAPVAAEGGYIPLVDHGVPDDVPYRNYLYYLQQRRRHSAAVTVASLRLRSATNSTQPVLTSIMSRLWRYSPLVASPQWATRGTSTKPGLGTRIV